MRSGVQTLFRNPLYYLLPFSLLAVIVDLLGVSPIIVLIITAVGIIPVAGLIGEGTEAVAAQAGPRLSGLLNATFGNAAELIITIVAIRAGLLELVKASITGSIIGNLLIVFGLSMLVGGLQHGVQSFDRQKVSRDSILLVLAVTALAVPSLFVGASDGIHDAVGIEVLSLGVALLMMIIYVLGLFYGFRIDVRNPFTRESVEDLVHHPRWSIRAGVLVLLVGTLAVVLLSEILIRQIEPTMESLGISEFFIGIILIPLVGNVAEHLVAISVAMKNQMTLSAEIAIGSSLQIALFVVPVLVFLSLLIGNPLTLVFNSFELIALVAAVWIAALVSEDGKSNWLEGAVLVALYLIFALAFFFLR